MITRRSFIKTSAMAALPFSLSGFPLFATAQPKTSLLDEENDKILVLVQLQGGNDGLATLYHAAEYGNLSVVRNNIIVPENTILNIEDAYGFHPSMQGLKDVWDLECLGIVQNVGYPNQNRSHFRSTDIWNAASSAEDFVSTGWIGRFYDLNYADYPNGYPNTANPHPFALTMGKIVSETCQGINANYSLSLLDPFNPGTALVSAEGDIANDCYGDALSFVNETVAQTNAFSQVIQDAAHSGNNLSSKWDNLSTELSQKLKNVARLIAGGLQTKIYIVQLGGFDTHDNQVVGDETTTGRHSVLLQELSDAICAFQEDLRLLELEDRVVGMTYSEFGRRIRSNGALGTDHGTAAPLFVFGSCVENHILGSHPEIDTEVGIDEGVSMEYDFRDVYGTILNQWLGLSTSEVMDVLYPDFQALPLFKESCIPSDPCIDNAVRVNVNIQLQGAYNPNTKQMRTDLLDKRLLPLNQPFNQAPWYYESLESVNTFPSNAVDWVLLEVREGEVGESIVEQKAAIVLADGRIVDVGDFLGVRFCNLIEGNSYFVSVKVRNHLAVISRSAYVLPNVDAIDLSNPDEVLGGASQLGAIDETNYGLLCGDYDNNGIINVEDFNRFRSELAQLNVYANSDGSMDGNITVKDYNLYVPNASVIGVEQVRY